MSLDIAGDFNHYLIQYVFVEVWHVAMIRHRSIIIILEVLLQSHGVMWNIQYCIQVVGKHLEKKRHRHGCCFQSQFLQSSACFFTHSVTHRLPSMSGQLPAASLDSSPLWRLTQVFSNQVEAQQDSGGSIKDQSCYPEFRLETLGLLELCHCMFLSHGGRLDFELGAVTWLPLPHLQSEQFHWTDA